MGTYVELRIFAGPASEPSSVELVLDVLDYSHDCGGEVYWIVVIMVLGKRLYLDRASWNEVRGREWR